MVKKILNLILLGAIAFSFTLCSSAEKKKNLQLLSRQPKSNPLLQIEVSTLTLRKRLPIP